MVNSCQVISKAILLSPIFHFIWVCTVHPVQVTLYSSLWAPLLCSFVCMHVIHELCSLHEVPVFAGMPVSISLAQQLTLSWRTVLAVTLLECRKSFVATYWQGKSFQIYTTGRIDYCTCKILCVYVLQSSMLYLHLFCRARHWRSIPHPWTNICRDNMGPKGMYSVALCVHVYTNY